MSDACASYADLDRLNDELYPYVRNLASNTDFFSYYRLNLYNQKCPFWDEEGGMCGNIACAVTTLENEEDIPEVWRAQELSRLEGPKARHPGRQQQKERKRPLLGELGDDVGESCVVEYDDECDERDYCVPEDESASAKGDYVSLVDNPERFTGYGGEDAHQIWEAIYRENCFSKPQIRQSISSPGSSPFGAFSQQQAQAADDFKQVIKAHDRKQAMESGSPTTDALELEDECLEKRVFYRVISGMHASISTHLCHEYLNQTTGEWGPNLQCYQDRMLAHPERVSNLYFNYALVLRAVGKLKDYVQEYTFCTGDPTQDTKTKEMITTLAEAVPAGPQIFDESVMFQDTTSSGLGLKEDFRSRFRNVSRIMDCVGCDKCRLWGKLQTNGFGTALKVLFEFGTGQAAEDKPLLRRTELVALINTLDKISSALKALEHLRAMDAAVLDGGRSDVPEQPREIDREFAPDQESDDEDDLDSDAFMSTVIGNDELEDEGEENPFWTELSLVWRTLIFVLKSWATMPRFLYEVLHVEVVRLLALWMGKAVPERPWSIPRPTHEEL